MAKERVSRTICDRCKAVFEEREGESGSEDDATATPKVYVEEHGVEVLRFEDLCEKCDDRVNNLIKDLKLDKPEKKKKTKKSSAKKDSKNEQSAPEGEKPAG